MATWPKCATASSQGLNLTDADKEMAMANIFVAREDVRTGWQFFAETVRPLLIEHGPDLFGLTRRCRISAGKPILKRMSAAFCGTI